MKFLSNILKRVSNLLEGAQYNPRRRTFIHHGYTSARFDASAAERREIVRKSRYFEYNNAIANRLADIFETYTVGGGAPLLPNSSDTEWNQKARKSWNTFCKYPVVNSRMSFAQFQSLVARRWFFDGEAFVLLTTGDSGRPRIQLIETHLVQTPPELASREGVDIFDGVRVDRRSGGRPISYYIGQEDERGSIKSYRETDARFVVHVHEPWRANEYRGLPFITPVVNLLHDLDDLHQYEMQAAKTASAQGIFIKTDTGLISPTGLLRSRTRKTVLRSDGTTDEVDATEYYDTITSGTAKILRPRDDIVQVKGERPSVVTQDYWRLLREYVCAGVGIPAQLAFPESLQGTMARGMNALAAATFRARFGVLAEAWARVYEHYFRWAISIEPNLQPAPADWFEHTIQPPRSPDVDPGYTAAAAVNLLANGATTLDLIYGPQGHDWRAMIDALAEQAAYARARGLQFPWMSNQQNNISENNET